MKRLFILLLLAQASGLHAQFTMEEFLAAAVSDAELLEVQNSLRFLDEHRFNSPWIREVDLRLRSNNIQPSLEDYRLRFGLINPLVIKANSNYHRALGGSLTAEEAVKRSDVIRQRYFLMIENMDLNAMKSLYSTKLEALKRVAQLGPSDLGDWIDLQSDITKAELMVREVDQKLKINEFLILERMPEATAIELDTAQIIREEQVFRIIQKLNESDQTGLLTELSAQRTALRESVLKLERVENRSNIGYIQAEYDRDRGNNLNAHAGFQVGITLPLVNPNKPDYQREVLKQLENETKEAIEAKNQKQAAQIEALDLGYQQDNLLYLKQKMEQIQPLSSEMNTPELYLDYLNYVQYLQENYLSERSALLRSYISLLHDQGLFLEGPSVNYLSRNLSGY